MSVTLRFFYRRMYVHGLQNIPAQGPVILIANHASSLMDAAILGILLKRPIHYFARGDIFINSFVKSLLKMLHMMPVHHHQSGRQTIAKNEDSFAYAQTILEQGKMVLFFPEGTSHTERVMYPLKKGIFRVAFNTLEKNNWEMELPFIAIGINYSNPIAWQADVMVECGKPFFIHDYRDVYLYKPTVALRQVCEKATLALLQNTLHIAAETNFELADRLLEIQRNNYKPISIFWLQHEGNRFMQEKMFCDKINSLPVLHTISLKNNINLYFQQLQQYQITDAAAAGNIFLKWWHLFLLLLGFPLFLMGYILNGLPVLIAKRIADTKVTRIDFYTWIFSAAAGILYFLWLIFLFFLFSFISWQTACVMVLITLISGCWVFIYLKLWMFYKSSRRVSKLNAHTKSNLKQWRIQLYNMLYN